MADQSLCDDVYLNYIIVFCRRHDGWTVTLWCMSISIILLYILGGLMSEQSLCDDVYLNYIIVYFRRTWCLNSHFVMMSISIDSTTLIDNFYMKRYIYRIFNMNECLLNCYWYQLFYVRNCLTKLLLILFLSL